MHAIIEALSAIVLFFVVMFIIFVICKKIEQNKKMKWVKEKDQNEEKHPIDLEYYKKQAEKYKEENPNWNKIPEDISYYYVYAVVPVYMNGMKQPVTRFCCFSNISVKRDSIIIRYTEEDENFLNGRVKNERFIEFNKIDFNRTWFISKDLIMAEIADAIVNYHLNVNRHPMYYNEEGYDCNRLY